jgi:hypothetical protein
MSRAKIGAVVAVVVAALTLAAYFLTTRGMERGIRRDVEQRVAKARQLVIHIAAVQAKEMDSRVDALSRDPDLEGALKEEADPAKKADLMAQGKKAFQDFVKDQTTKPDFVGLTDREGNVVLMDVDFEPQNWKKDFPVVADALDKRELARDIWDYRNTVTKVGVAPVIDPITNEVRGSVVVAYALTARQATEQAEMIGMDVAYFFNGRVRATSFTQKGAEGDLTSLSQLLADKGLDKLSQDLSKGTPVVPLSINDDEYVATAAPLPYENKTSGAMVMMSLGKAMEPIGTVKVTIVLLGLGALLVALLAMLITARLLLNPAEEIELGVTEIINGNVDYTFKPAGADFDGLANALNVMLARLTGRPEPGDEPLDEDRPSTSSMVLEDAEKAAQGGSADPEAMALAQEPEPDYYKRIFGEYLAQRKDAGEKTEGVTFEGFVAKLRLSEANLKKKHGCRAVRFRIATKDGQVTLKPVPIY